MLPMKADLQELMITEEEIKEERSLESSLAQTGCFLVIFGIFPAFYISIIGVEFVSYLIGVTSSEFIVYSLTILIWISSLCFLNKYYNSDKIIQRRTLLLSQVEKHNQIITNLYTLDQLEAVGNPVKINDRIKVIEALKITREGLVRALKTERILNANPNFKPEYFNIDLTSLQAERTMAKAVEYAELLDQAVQIGVSVQKEMRKLQNNR